MYRIGYSPLHFTPSEFACKCGCGFCAPSTGLVIALDFFRRVWGQPVRITSGCRCASHNKAVGGVPSSRHLDGLAADIQPIDLALIGPFVNLVEHCFGGLSGWELKIYPRFVHVAVPRAAWPVWSGNKIYFETYP